MIHPKTAMAICISDYPQLKLIAWNRQEDELLAEEDALALYERNWRYVDQRALTSKEWALINRLVRDHGNGVLHV